MTLRYVVLLAVLLVTGCSQDDTRRDVYKSREDCLADWSNKPEDCTRATDPKHARSGFWYGPSYGYHSSGSGSTWTRSSSGRSMGSISSGVSRGGFGSACFRGGGCARAVFSAGAAEPTANAFADDP